MEFVDPGQRNGIKQVLSLPRCPRQRAYVERVIGSIPRECQDNIIVVDECSLVGTLTRDAATTIAGELTCRLTRTHLIAVVLSRKV